MLVSLPSEGVGQPAYGNLYVHVQDPQGYPYEGYLIKLQTYRADSGKWLTYQRMEQVVEVYMPAQVFAHLPQGKYRIWVQCMRRFTRYGGQTEAFKDVSFSPAGNVYQVVITLHQKQYWH